MQTDKNSKFTFFYTSESPFSNFYPCSFEIDGVKFNCSEQCMMYGKAKLFNDDQVAEMILSESSPRKIKAHGRNVSGFDEQTWTANRVAIVHRALKAKFGQNAELLEKLLATGDTLLVEASPSDKIWGIGLSQDNPLAQSKSTWKGLNLLGQILTDVREELKKEKPNTS